MKKLLSFFGALTLIATASPLYTISCARNTQASFNNNVNDLKKINTGQIYFGVTSVKDANDSVFISVQKELLELMKIAGAVTFKNPHDYLTWYNKNVTEDSIQIFKKPNINQQIIDEDGLKDIGITIENNKNIFQIEPKENISEFYIKFNFAELENNYYRINLTSKALIQIDNNNYISGLNNGSLNKEKNNKIDILTGQLKQFYSTVFDDSGKTINPNSSSWKVVRHWFFSQVQEFIHDSYFWMPSINFDDNTLSRYTLINMLEINFESFFSAEQVEKEYTDALGEIIKSAYNDTEICNHIFKLAKTSEKEDFFTVTFNYV